MVYINVENDKIYLDGELKIHDEVIELIEKLNSARINLWPYEVEHYRNSQRDE